jgi:hypothetical protein
LRPSEGNPRHPNRDVTRAAAKRLALPLACAILLTLAGWGIAATVSAAAHIQQLLASEGGFTPSLWASVQAGHVEAKTLDTPDRAEVMTLAVTEVRASRERFLACARDVSCLRRNEDVLQLGRLSPAPELADLAGLSLDPKDLDYLHKCRIGACDMRLSQEAIGRFQHEVDWSSTSNPQRAELLLRQVLAQHAAAYALGGAATLPVYDDNSLPVPIGNVLADLLHRRMFSLDLDPALAAHVAELGPPPAGTDDFLYWYKERFWRKSLVALCHVSIREATSEGSELAYVLSRQIYASHYFDGAIELTLYIAPPGSDRGLLVFLSRARADIRPSGFTWYERIIINRLVRRRLEGQLREMRDRLQAPAASGTRTPAAPGSP